jgi:hypothetical protein
VAHGGGWRTNLMIKNNIKKSHFAKKAPDKKKAHSIKSLIFFKKKTVKTLETTVLQVHQQLLYSAPRPSRQGSEATPTWASSRRGGQLLAGTRVRLLVRKHGLNQIPTPRRGRPIATVSSFPPLTPPLPEASRLRHASRRPRGALPPRRRGRVPGRRTLLRGLTRPPAQP